MVFNATFNNSSATSWLSVVFVEEIGVSGENYRPDTSHWQTLSHTVAVQGLNIWWIYLKFCWSIFLCINILWDFVQGLNIWWIYLKFCWSIFLCINILWDFVLCIGPKENLSWDEISLVLKQNKNVDI